MAVQIFPVVAGFLTARSLAPDGVLCSERPLTLLWQRFVRVSLPLMGYVPSLRLLMTVHYDCSTSRHHFLVMSSVILSYFLSNWLLFR